MRKIGLHDEFFLADDLIKSGLGLLQQRGDQRFVFMLVLSSGLERLMKATLCVHHCLLNDGRFPAHSTMHKLGHNLVKLKDSVVDSCYHDLVRRVPAIVDDIAFLNSDPTLNATLGALTQFAQRGRYASLTLATTGSIEPGGFAWQIWEEAEKIALGGLENAVLGNYALFKDTATQRIVESVEAAVRAMARTINFIDGASPLAVNARSFGPALGAFGGLQDEKLGTRRYSITRN